MEVMLYYIEEEIEWSKCLKPYLPSEKSGECEMEVIKGEEIKIRIILKKRFSGEMTKECGECEMEVIEGEEIKIRIIFNNGFSGQSV
jgi:hypothetical protein